MAYKDGVITGPLILNNSGSGNTTIGTGSNSGTINLGNTNSGAVSVDCGTAGITVGTTSNAHATTLGSTNTTSSTTVQSGSGALNVTSSNGAITANSGTGTVGISTDASATTINIATGAGAKTLNLGSTNTTSTTTFDVGSGGLNIPAFTEGAIVTDSSGTVSSVTGTAGYVLTSNGTSTAPSFQAFTPGGGGSLVFLAQNTFSGASSTAFTSTYINGTYSNYFVLLNNVTSASGGVLHLTISDDNGSSYKSTNYGGGIFRTSGTTPTQGANVSTSYFILHFGSGSSFQVNGFIYLYNLGTSGNMSLLGETSSFESTSHTKGQVYGYYDGSSITVNNIKFTPLSSTITGTITLYGITN